MAILVVDDSRAMRMIVRRELRQAGYEDVVEAENGTVALEMITGGGVDLVLSDWNMPDVNGIDLLARLRAAGHPVAFGFVTSESAPDVRARALRSGASFVLTKPFTSQDLDREITLALGEEAAADDTTGPAERTLDGVLAGLLGREVSVTPAPGPERSAPRGLAEYETGAPARKVYAVVEMPLAAGLACALARVPSRQAQEWARAHAFNDAMEANFFEVANVLGAFASPSGERCVLRAVHALTEGELWADLRGQAEWHTTVRIDIAGYPSGRLGFVAA